MFNEKKFRFKVSMRNTACSIPILEIHDDQKYIPNSQKPCRKEHYLTVLLDYV